MNVSAVFNAFRILVKPTLLLPHAIFTTFDEIPIPVGKAFAAANGGVPPDIKAVVLDKDNCFAKPRHNTIYEPYYVRPQMILSFVGAARILLSYGFLE